MIFIASFLFVFYVALIGILYSLQESMTFPVPREISPHLPAGVQKIDIAMPDGVILKMVRLTRPNSKAEVLFFHGNGSSTLHELQRGLALREAGYNVLLAEYRGYGGSSGSPSSEMLLADALVTHDWLRKQNNAPIIVYAHSLGTGIAQHVAAERDVAAVALEASYVALEEVAANRFLWLPVKALFNNPIPAYKFIIDVKAPVLMVHGEQDQVIPIEFGEALFKHAPEGALWMPIPNAGHNNLLSYGSLEIVLKFLTEHRL